MKSKNSEKVFEYLKEKIMNCEWQDGDQITPEIQLSKELEVGRNAVREAIEKLVGMKVLVKKKGKGTFVQSRIIDLEFNNMLINTMINKDDYDNILEFRKTFEPENIRLFIKNANEGEYEELKKIYEAMIENRNDRDKFSYYDAMFHNLIAKGTKNSIIIKISDVLSSIMISHQKKLNVILGSESGIKEHTLILEAIMEKDEDMAYLFMRKHITRTIKDVLHVKNKNT